MWPLWPHLLTLYRSPQICLISNLTLFHLVKLERSDYLMILSTNSFEGTIPNVLIHTTVSDSKNSENLLLRIHLLRHLS